MVPVGTFPRHGSIAFGTGSTRRTNCCRFETTAMKVEKWNASKDGPMSRSNVVAKLKKAGYAAKCRTLYPGAAFPGHQHKRAKKDTVISGKFLVQMEGEAVILQPGDIVEVPAGVFHYEQAVGEEPVEFVDASKV